VPKASRSLLLLLLADRISQTEKEEKTFPNFLLKLPPKTNPPFISCFFLRAQSLPKLKSAKVLSSISECEFA
jgi:hypothetical protein